MRFVTVLLLILLWSSVRAQNRRARELGLHIGVMAPGAWNAITDVPGVKVGQTTLVKGDSVHTGVTAILPYDGNIFQQKVPAAIFAGNGFGKLAGTTQVQELGNLETPVVLQRIELHNDYISPLFMAAIEATEEAIVNSLFAAVSTKDKDGHIIEALPLEKVKAMLKKYNRIK